MYSQRKYQELAFDCLKFAEGTCNPGTRDAFIRMAEVWAAQADRAENDPKRTSPTARES
jgi:hypothetical protein